MSYGLGNIFSMGTLQGAASGALTGGLASGFNPYAMAAGGLAGGAMGSYADYQRDKGSKAAVSSIEQAMKNINAFKQKDYAQRISDLKQVQSFYAPAISQWNSMYGTGPATTSNPGSYGLAGMPSSGRF